MIKPGTPNVLTADGLLTLNKDGNDWPSIEVEIITWDVTYDGQYCFDQRGPGELHVSGNLEPGTNYDFVVNQPITFSFSEQVYKVCVSPNWRESFELEPVNGNYSYTPTEDRALRFEVFMTQDDYEFEQFRPNHDAGEFSVNYGLGVDDDVFVGNNPVITYGNVIPEASMTLRNQTRLILQNVTVLPIVINVPTNADYTVHVDGRDDDEVTAEVKANNNVLELNVSEPWNIPYVDVQVFANGDGLQLQFRHNCEFDNNLAMHYVIPQSQLKGYSNIRLMIEMEQYAKNVVTPTWKQVELSNPTDYKIGNEDYWHFVFTGIAASEMGNVIKAKVVCEKDGTTYESRVDEYSVKAYAYDRLANSKSATYKTLLVDMLNYGAAAQTHFGKNVNNLVNADLTTEQRNLGTPLSQFGVTSCENLIGEGTYPAAFEMKNLLYDTNVVLMFRMDFPADYKMDNVKVKFSYVNGKNVMKTRTVPFANFGKSGGKYMVGCEGITPAEMDCVIDATIYDGDKAISQTLQYSIESYVASRIEESTSTTYKNLMRLMILYGQAAKKHFG